MNQDQVKDKLLQLGKPTKEFTLIFSGKKSKKVDGLYKSDERQIILHNKNFANDNELIYTAIHEFAHHIQFTESSLPISSRAHTTAFWSLFHSLLKEAEEMGLYVSIFEQKQEFVVLTRQIKEEFLQVNGNLMKDFGELLLKARGLCEKYGTSFEDYLDRILCIPRSSAKTIMRSHQFNLNPQIGFENMRTVASIPSQATREQAQEDLINGDSPDMVRMRYITAPKQLDELQVLKTEKTRIEKTIRTLNTRLEELNRRISDHAGT